MQAQKLIASMPCLPIQRNGHKSSRKIFAQQPCMAIAINST
jgi:hypothetical protein